jgi:hypothetical protein
MHNLYRILLFLLIVHIPFPIAACGSQINIAEKPEGLRYVNRDPSNYYLTTSDRLKWKLVLNWSDECDERARPALESSEGRYGRIFVNAIGEKQYIVDIQCYTTMRQSEHIYYKITDHGDTIESRLLVLEQFYRAEYGDNDYVEGVKDPKGEFVRFIDSVAYGHTNYYWDKPLEQRLYVKREFVGLGNCGLFTIYDVSGDCPKVIEFRANLSCTLDDPMEDKWRIYTPAQRAKWRIVPSPIRKEWKSPSNPPCSP